MADERFLLTGATGFVGAAVLRLLLDSGAEVHGVSAKGRPGPVGARMHRCDLLDERAVTPLLNAVRPTHLIHCAWDVSHGAYWTASANLAWLAAGVTLLRSFLAAGGQRAVGVGTCAEYAWTAETYTEGYSITAPATPYGRCKLALYEAHEAARLMGASTAWARLFFPYGPGDGEARFLPSLVRSLRAGKPFDTTSGTQRRDFIHIEDVAGGLVALARSSVTGAVNLGTGTGPSLREVALEAARALRVDPALLRFGALPPREGDPASLLADVYRLQVEVGYAPRVGWQEGVARFAAG